MFLPLQRTFSRACAWTLLIGLFTISAAAQVNPVADHHAHLLSPQGAHLLSAGGVPDEDSRPSSAHELILALDKAHVQRAAALSSAYFLGALSIHVANEAAEVDRENAWTAAQAALYPHRLFAFCSVNPLKPYAAAAIRHCAALGIHGLKLHLANSRFDFDNPGNIRALAAVFHQANQQHMAILIHLRSGARWSAQPIGIFFRQVLPQAPDVTIQIAHLTGWGGYDRATDASASALADLCAANPAPCRNLYFDIAMVILPPSFLTAAPGSDQRFLADQQRDFPDAPQRLAANLRRFGLHRILFATDWPDATPDKYRDALRAQLALSPAEINQIFENAAPYFALAATRNSQ